MVISRINGSAIKKAMVDLRCISLCRLLRPAAFTAIGSLAAISAIVRSDVAGPRATGGAPPEGHAPPFACTRLVAHEAFDLFRRPVERLVHGIALVVADGHLGRDTLVVDLLGDLVRRGCCG